jgi:hypothetical protein
MRLNVNVNEETRYGIILVVGLLVLLLLMLAMNFFLGDDKKPGENDKQKEKTVIITQSKEGAPPPLPSVKSVVSTVRDAIKQGNYSTAFMEVNNVPKNSPEYDEFRKALTEETRKRKAPGVRKDDTISPSAPVRYLDESTPRNRTTDAIYVYFVDLSGTLCLRFCIQAAEKRPLGITGFTITADARTIRINAPSVKVENTEKGVAEWYDVPLDRQTYDAALAITKAKKVTLAIEGSRGKSSRDVTDNEKKGIRRVLDGYAALGGSLMYLQESKQPVAVRKKQPHL